MKHASWLFAAVALCGSSALAQTVPGSAFKLALPDHPGKLKWSADGFTVLQSSAKPNGREIGIRGRDGSHRLTFLAFLFVFPEQAPLTSAKCREGVLGPEEKSNPNLKIATRSEIVRAGQLPVAVAIYSAQAKTGSTIYSVRGFIASGDVCGDLELYSEKPISAEDADIKGILATYQLEEHYAPRFSDILVYAQVLYKTRMYAAAAPMFEQALMRLKDEPSAVTKDGRRILIDQAGMAYGISGQIAKARAILERAVAEDPDYPLYYYNLACADAEENKLQDARLHLQQAFARKANVVAGEAMPDPTKDDSFLPHRDNRDFWKFVEGLQANR
ncbi:MAG: tetratricopeptide repeat protein [Bryobacteraceae bacterium]